MIGKTFIYAEVKICSPFGWRSEHSWDELFEVANKIGDALSIHTDPRWGGSFELLSRARSLTKKPILAKGIHAHDDEVARAVDLGAQNVLVVGRVPKVHTEQCLIEPMTFEELIELPADIKAVWNSRDLNNGGMKTESFGQAREAFTGWLCQASNIKSVADVHPDADAALVGTNLLAFASSLKKL
jgi:indole-3-glycerol phosphate synthase